MGVYKRECENCELPADICMCEDVIDHYESNDYTYDTINKYGKIEQDCD